MERPTRHLHHSARLSRVGAGDRGSWRGNLRQQDRCRLSRIFRFAVDEEIIEANPAARLPKPGVEIGSRPEGELAAKAYSADEVRTILESH